MKIGQWLISECLRKAAFKWMRGVAAMVRRLEREKRNVAAFIPWWDPTAYIPCGNCLAICSEAAIRMKTYEEKFSRVRSRRSSPRR